MTTAFPEPYGLALRGAGTDVNFRPLYDRLPKGVNYITVSTQHPGWVAIRVSPEASWTDPKILGTIPEGEGHRSITVTHSVGADEDSYIVVSGAATLTHNDRASVTVVTIPLKGAGR